MPFVASRRAVLLLGAAALAAPAFAAGRSPREHVVVMDKMAFGPSPKGVRPGDVIVWVNRDIFRHTATARDKSFDIDLAPGKQVRMAVKKSGKVDFYCRFHPGMTGVLTVAS